MALYVLAYIYIRACCTLQLKFRGPRRRTCPEICSRRRLRSLRGTNRWPRCERSLRDDVRSVARLVEPVASTHGSEGPAQTIGERPRVDSERSALRPWSASASTFLNATSEASSASSSPSRRRTGSVCPAQTVDRRPRVDERLPAAPESFGVSVHILKEDFRGVERLTEAPRVDIRDR